MILDGGMDFEFDKIIISPEIRYFIAGGAFSDIDPRGNDFEENEMPSFWSVLIGIGFKL